MRSGKHLIFAAVMMLLLTAVLVSCTHAPSDAFTVDFYKIGKADAMFLHGTGDDGKRFSILIDTGESDDAVEIAEKIRQSGTETLDYLILTHFDKDHIGGLVPLLSVLSAETILMPDYVGEGEPYEAMAALFAGGAYNTQVLTEDFSFTLGNTAFSVSVPKTAVYEKKQDNNSSLVITVTHGNNTLYLAGDAEA
ncbi:MAG: MBL fold metallo-hydrolase, partial [Clostridia bacterium]|nr:MBL fold metallo-hydrolase [Clostridia bacterium]